MPFDGGGQFEHRIAVEVVVLGERGGRGDACHDGLGGRTHATGLGDVVVRVKNETDTPQAEGLAGAAEGGDHQMRFVARQGVLALALDQYLRRGVHRIGAQREFKLVVIVQGQTDRIEAGTKIGAGRRHAHVHLASNWSHTSLSFITSSLQITHRIHIRAKSHIKPMATARRGTAECRGHEPDAGTISSARAESTARRRRSRAGRHP